MSIYRRIFYFVEGGLSQSIFFLLLILVNPCIVLSQENNTSTRRTSPLYLRAPDVMPGTLPEMRESSYWINRMQNPGSIVLTLDDIKSRNKQYHQKLKGISELESNLVQQIEGEFRSRPGLEGISVDPNSLKEKEIFSLIKDIIDKQVSYLRSRKFGNILGIEYSPEELDAIENEISYSSPEKKIEIKKGITVEESALRIIPSLRPEFIGLINTGKTRWDLWNLDILPIATPVEVLHTSKSGRFLFILSDRGYGWIPSENIALGLKSEIENFVNAENFVICTGDKVPFYTDSTSTYGSGWFKMGNLLPRANLSNPRLIIVPTRRANGSLNMQEVWLAKDADVSQGYMEYNRKNVIVQAFKLLDNIYDWTGGWYGRNHATVFRDIYSCFGFDLPSNGILFSVFGNQPEKVSPDAGRAAQYNAIKSKAPFLTLQVSGSGHSQLLLGNYKGMPIVFDTHGYNYTDDAGNELEIKRFVVGTVLFPDYMLNQPITFIELD